MHHGLFAVAAAVIAAEDEEQRARGVVLHHARRLQTSAARHRRQRLPCRAARVLQTPSPEAGLPVRLSARHVDITAAVPCGAALVDGGGQRRQRLLRHLTVAQGEKENVAVRGLAVVTADAHHAVAHADAHAVGGRVGQAARHLPLLRVGAARPHLVVEALGAALCGRTVGEVAAAGYDDGAVAQGAGKRRGDALSRTGLECGERSERDVVVLVVVALRPGMAHSNAYEQGQNEEGVSHIFKVFWFLSANIRKNRDGERLSSHF